MRANASRVKCQNHLKQLATAHSYSVRFVSDRVDRIAWQNAGTRNAGDVAGDF